MVHLLGSYTSAGWCTVTPIGSIGLGANSLTVFVSGNYAYVTTYGSSTLSIYDVSNPKVPVKVGSINTGTGYPQPVSVYVKGRYAYVTNGGNNNLSIFDVSNPAINCSSNCAVGTLSTGSYPNSVYVQGHYAYVTNEFGSAIQIFDITNPAVNCSSNCAVGNLSTGATSVPDDVYVQGNDAYVVSKTTDTLQIFNISNPAVSCSSNCATGTFSLGGNLSSVYVSGRYAYVTNQTNSTLQVVDVSNSSINCSSNCAVSTVSTGNTPSSVYVQGRYTYVASVNYGLNVFDISNPANPLPVGGYYSPNFIYGLFVSGRYAYIVSNSPSTLQIFDLGGAYIQQEQTGGLETGTLQVDNNATISGDESIQGGLNVSQSTAIDGSLGVSGSTLLEDSTNSTSAFQVQNSTGSDLLTADTTNMRVGVDVSYTPMSSPTGLTAATNAASGSLSGTYRYEVTAIDSAGGETTVASGSEVTQATGGSTSIGLYWNAVTGASGYNIYRTAAGGASGSEVYLTTVLSNYSSSSPFIDNGSITPGTASPPTTNTAYVSANSSNNDLQLSVGGNGTPIGQLYVSGLVPLNILGSTTNNINDGGNVFVSGDYAYITSQNNQEMVIDNISNPASPTYVGETGTTHFNNPYGIYVAGHYAYVTDVNNNQMVVYDVSNPASPVYAGATDTAHLRYPYAVYVSGNNAYIASYSSNQIIIYNVSNPASPIYVGETNPTYLNGPSSIYVQGNYAYAASSNNSELVVFNIANPASPSYAGESGTTYLNYPNSVYVQGDYAYVSSADNNQIVTYNISNPTTPVYAGKTASSDLDNPTDIYVQGRYAYVTSYSNNELVIFDVSSPGEPNYVGQVSTGANSAPNSVVVSGRYAYVVSQNSSALTTFDLGGTYTQQLQAGGTETGTLTVDNNAAIYGDESIQSGLSVGGNTELNGGLGVAGSVSFQNSANSTSAFQVSNAAGSGILNVDTTNSRVGIGSLSPTAISQATLAHGGSLTTGNTYYFIVTGVDGSGGQTAASAEYTGSGVTNSTTGYQEYNLTWSAVADAVSYDVYYGTASQEENYYCPNITTTTYTFSATTCAGNTSGTPPAYSSAYADRLSATSNIFQPTAGSTTALEVLNTSSLALLDVNSSASPNIVQVGTGTAGSTYVLLGLSNYGTNSSDPTEQDGAMYYNSTLGKFRCGEGGAWENCVGSLNSANTAASTTLNGNTTRSSKLFVLPPVYRPNIVSRDGL